MKPNTDIDRGTLALPSSTLNPSESDFLEAPSGRLFLRRARAVSPDFAITEDNAGAVAAICWRLAGLLLALELTAARARFMDPAALLARLDRALERAWARDLPERQRTMRTTLDWSHDLLTEEQRVLFRRLSVFSGGFTLEAAEEVCAFGEVLLVCFLCGHRSSVDGRWHPSQDTYLSAYSPNLAERRSAEFATRGARLYAKTTEPTDVGGDQDEESGCCRVPVAGRRDGVSR
jgi:hypothetical protein